MATLKAIQTAAKDNDLRERLIAAAALEGITDPAAWVDQHMPNLVASEAEPGQPSRIADVYEYAVGQYGALPMRPGEDPQWVTDAHLVNAVRAVKG